MFRRCANTTCLHQRKCSLNIQHSYREQNKSGQSAMFRQCLNTTCVHRKKSTFTLNTISSRSAVFEQCSNAACITKSLRSHPTPLQVEQQISQHNLFRYPFHPRVTAVARKRSRSFCQKCRWQVTAKHTCILPMWLRMK